MSRYLISVGCSFAFGQGLEDRTLAYPHLIAQRSNRILVPGHKPGSDNSLLVNTATELCLQTLRNQQESFNLVVLFGWTDPLRHPFWDKKNGRMGTLLPTQGYRFHSSSRRVVDPEYAGICDFFFKNMWDANYSARVFVKDFNLINLMVDKLNVSIIHLANLRPFDLRFKSSDLFFPDHNERYLQFIKDKSLVDLIHSEPKKYAMSAIEDENGKITPESDFHPNELAHKMWADKITHKYASILGS